MGLLSMKVSGNRDLPARLEGKRLAYVQEASRLIHEDLEAEAPYQHISQSAWTKIERRGGGVGIAAGYDAVDAKAHDQGAYIVPKNRKVLRFADGSFRMHARLQAQHYFERVEGRAYERLREAFRTVFR